MTFEKLPAFVTEAIKALQSAGHEAYLVGGCVRDILRGERPHDFDLTTSALPEQTKAVFSAYKQADTGIKHGTVTVLFGDEPVEITTFRTESGYSDNRHPDHVGFTSKLPEDLKRRDFTMNALAWSPQTGVVDLFGGEEDIKNHLIRCVGIPEERFGEDALRILRALRFSSVLDFEIEKETSEAIHVQKELLKNVSSERIYMELRVLLVGDGVERILTDYADVITVFLPELAPCIGFEQRSDFHLYDVYTHTVKVVSALNIHPYLRLAALLHDIGKPLCCQYENGITHFKGHPQKSAELARKALQRLHAERSVTDYVCDLIEKHDDYAIYREKDLFSLLAEMPLFEVYDLLKLMEADNSAKSPLVAGDREEIEKTRKALDELLSSGVPLSVSQLQITGDDLQALGIPAGKQLGDTLKKLLTEVQKGNVKNEKAALLQTVKNWN